MEVLVVMEVTAMEGGARACSSKVVMIPVVVPVVVVTVEPFGSKSSSTIGTEAS